MRKIFNIYTGKELFVPCGKCKACLQEKAMKRAERIRSHCKDKLCLFLTLTYDNRFVPYIDIDDVLNDDGFIPVYRDSSAFSRKNGNHISKYSDNLSMIIDEFQVPEDYIRTTDFFRLQGLQHRSFDHIGVCYYRDGINFIKKLRQNLIRRFNYYGKFQYFLCSEYGPQTNRPHFHAVLFCEKSSSYSMWKSAVASSWTFDDSNRLYQCEIARNPASYVASYVNSNSYTPTLLHAKVFKSKCSYSQGLGMDDYWFTLDVILQKIFEHDCKYPKSVIKDGKPNVSSIPYPSFVIHRFFPKIPGYHRLTSDEIINLYENPRRIFGYGKKLRYSPEDLKRVYVMLSNRVNLYISHGYSSMDFALGTYLCYSIRGSDSIINNHIVINEERAPQYQAYDNIVEMLFSGLYSDVVATDLPSDIIIDPNEFPFRKIRTSRLVEQYENNDKSRKLNNYRDSLKFNV